MAISSSILSDLKISNKVDVAFGTASHQIAEGGTFDVGTPITGEKLATIRTTPKKVYDKIVDESAEVFKEWRMVPAPERGMLVREIADALRDSKEKLGKLISLEVGKILPEGLGEVQEAIDIADFAVGLSRQLYGKTMHSERPSHRMYEQWHPLGVVGVITAFNFPCAVWAWNSMLAAVCGNVTVWKPSELAPLTALAVNSLCREVAAQRNFAGIFNLVFGEGPELGQSIAADTRIQLVSATGSCRMGRSVAETVGKRLGRSLLELGGNNAVIVLKDADLKQVTSGVLFGAVGTAGQRCTAIRRLYVEKSLASDLTSRLVQAYKQVKIGDPLVDGTLMGPLISQAAVDSYKSALDRIVKEGGKVVYGGALLKNKPSNLYVEPTIVSATASMKVVAEETFAPILYIIPVESLGEAIELNNNVPQGLSSAIFTKDLKSAERFLSHAGSDCGIANVNIGTSGAEIGGAFGGEKDTGGGRESGSDSWKQYMRRQTSTINFGDKMPLAQGIKFE